MVDNSKNHKIKILRIAPLVLGLFALPLVAHSEYDHRQAAQDQADYSQRMNYFRGYASFNSLSELLAVSIGVLLNCA